MADEIANNLTISSDEQNDSYSINGTFFAPNPDMLRYGLAQDEIEKVLQRLKEGELTVLQTGESCQIEVANLEYGESIPAIVGNKDEYLKAKETNKDSQEIN